MLKGFSFQHDLTVHAVEGLGLRAPKPSTQALRVQGTDFSVQGLGSRQHVHLRVVQKVLLEEGPLRIRFPDEGS